MANTAQASSKSTEEEAQWIIAQLGAREHYAAARAFHRQGKLYRFYTDAWCWWGRGLLRTIGGPGRAFANRYHEELPSQKVTAFNRMSISHHVRRLLRRLTDQSINRGEEYVALGSDFSRRVVRQLKRHGIPNGSPRFLGFSTGCLETLRYLETRGVQTIVDQFSPGPVEREIVRQERERWPGWAASSPPHCSALDDRVRSEWESASLILANSAWTRDALLREGIEDDRIVLVPAVYEGPTVQNTTSTRQGDGMRVLWMGTVGLRKGIQYLIQAANRLQNQEIEFIVAGALDITSYARSQAPPKMEFLGRVHRDRVDALYRSSDVFVFPTLSDGFGIVQLEAMARGLPVITTPNCGRVVTHGEDGYVVEPRSVDDLTEAILALYEEPHLREEMGNQAQQTVRSYSLDTYSRRLVAEVNQAL